MSEDFLHYIWKFQLFNAEQLTTTQGLAVQVLSPGMHNHQSGPDFFNAKIEIDSVLWAGQVEIHTKSSYWYTHKHHLDPSYNNTILHVVWENDRPALYPNKSEIPCIELKGKVSKAMLERFSSLIKSKSRIPCHGQLGEVDELKTHLWLDRLAIERLERKVSAVEHWLTLANSNWQEAFWTGLCSYWGMNVNSEPMQLVSKFMPFGRLLKQRNNLLALEALLLGAAGFLSASHDDTYVLKLQTEFQHQCTKQNISVVPLVMWKTGGIRPASSPTLRLAQLASLVYHLGDLFDYFILSSAKDLSILPRIKASAFWDIHYNLQHTSLRKEKTIGRQSWNIILINTVAPFMYYYGKQQLFPDFEQKPVQLLNNLDAERNSLINNWKQNNIFASNALQSQALIELTNNYCKPKKCVTCGIGKQILVK